MSREYRHAELESGHLETENKRVSRCKVFDVTATVVVCAIALGAYSLPGTARSQTRESDGASAPVDQSTEAKRVQQRLSRLLVEIQEWVQSGGDHSRVAVLGEQIGAHLKAGEYGKADKLMDQITAIVRGGGELPPRASSNARGAAQPTLPNSVPRSGPASNIGPSRQVRLGLIGPNAEIAFFLYQGRIPKPGQPGGIQDVYVCDRLGGNLIQITFNSAPKGYEHVAVSPDRTRMVVNYWVRQSPQEAPRSLLWLLDLKNKSETQLVPDFHSAGEGGIDWDLDGYVYFSAEPSRAAPRTMPKRSIYKIKYDGTGLGN